MHTGSTRTASSACGAGAIILAVGGVATQIVQTSTTVSDQVWSYPWSSATSIPITLLWAFGQALLVVGVLGLRRSGAAGPSRAARVGLAMAVVGTSLVIVGHIASIPVRDDSIHATGPEIAGSIYGLATVVSAVGFLLAGRATIRAGVWGDWQRFTPLATGLACLALLGLQFTKVLPTAVTIYALCFLAISFALRGSSGRVPTPAATQWTTTETAPIDLERFER
jgi:hypothetical protein